MSKLNIVADQNMAGVENYFMSLGNIQLVEGRQLCATDLVDVDVLLVRSVTRVNSELLASSNVRFVGTATSGFDHVDRDYLQQNNIGFSHAPGSNANSVVEYVLAVIASVDDKLEKLLAGGPIGIIGYGNIGRALEARCAALGIRCKVYDPWLPTASVSNAVELVDVLNCEVVSLHAELTQKRPWPSFHLLGESQLRNVPRDTLLINAGRGELVDNMALLVLLEQGKGPRTVLDVWEGEPIVSPELLAKVEWGTAHIAGYSLDGKYLATRMLRDAVVSHFNLVCPQNDVGPNAAPAIQVQADLTGIDLLRWALTARYNITEDDSLLRQTMCEVSPEERAAAFDLLRKGYRERRELMGSLVHTHDSREQERLLAALGCVVNPVRPFG